MRLRKIIIVGDAGRGKSTLASKLSEKLKIPHYSTDDYFYEVKFSKSREREDALSLISEIYKEDSWIVEGTTYWLLDPGIDISDMVIYLRHRSIFSQWFILLKRGLKRENEKLPETLILMKHVFYKRYGLGYKKGKTTHAEFVKPHAHKVVTLSSFKEIDEFLKNL